MGYDSFNSAKIWEAQFFWSLSRSSYWVKWWLCSLSLIQKAFLNYRFLVWDFFNDCSIELFFLFHIVSIFTQLNFAAEFRVQQIEI